MNKIFVYLFFIFLSSNLYSQLKGLVKDDKDIVLANANVIVLDSIKNIETFAITNNLGEFEISNFYLGSKTIQIKKPTFALYEEEIRIDKQIIDLGVFNLQNEDAINLKEVIVKSMEKK